ncbi:MAG: integrase, partial [Betaproteobacteria bacterium]
GFQFRDLRTKAGTDKADSTDLRGAQQQLGHRSVKTTEVYLRARAGDKVTPTK